MSASTPKQVWVILYKSYEGVKKVKSLAQTFRYDDGGLSLSVPYNPMRKVNKKIGIFRPSSLSEKIELPR